ncbi:MAG: carbamoyltransferase HypF [Anaerolineae bacterium]
MAAGADEGTPLAERADLILRKVHVTGVVQGVGFRPFVYQLADRYGLTGWVCNTSAGVDIEVEGRREVLDRFLFDLQAEAPPLARIEKVTSSDHPPNGYDHFEIRHSVAQEGRFQPISPDICTCPDCLRELFDPRDRRYRYPFTNCTNCGPRFTIIQDIPYDRPKTTMRPFVMCPVCQAEYDDPLDRRFHAQPNACPECGPKVWLAQSPKSKVQSQNLLASDGSTEASTVSGSTEPSAVRLSLDGEALRACPEPDEGASARRLAEVSGLGTLDYADDPIERARQLLTQGAIVAVKGLGGFHLACDATNDEAVRRLRERKGRVDKPFAIMSYDLETVKRYCYVNEEEGRLLESRERPIVLLRERPDSPISEWVAPGNKYLGVMLPYTPLHYLLLSNEERVMSDERDSSLLALVMTSGNYSEEPIATDNREALERLACLADYFLLHDRDIHARCDDSVVRVFQGQELPIRRSRGYAPYPVRLPFQVRQILACGAELKNTFCLTKENYAFLSQHIGNMENFETLVSYEAMIEHFKRLFRVEPEIIAYDMHPEYLATKYAKSQIANRKSQIAVQHHHAHIAACMAEQGLEEPVIGVAFDGTGYGADGRIWGGEFLVCDYTDFRRAAHLAYVPLPGGEAAIRRPYRMAWSHLRHAYGSLDLDLPTMEGLDPLEQKVAWHQMEAGLNSPLTSSMGRLFDAVSALIGLRQMVNYEAQAAIELEMIAAEGVEEAYEWGYRRGPELRRRAAEGMQDGPWIVDPAPVIRGVVADLRANVQRPIIAARFHNAVAHMVSEVCGLIREREGLNRVALSGGVFQNVYLLARTLELLRRAGFKVYIHHLVPPNDGGIALGQAVIGHFSCARG